MNKNSWFLQLRNNKYLISIILVSLFPAVPFFTSSDLLHTHDGLVHLPRLAAYYQALLDGHFPVRFAGYLNYGYGLPLFNYIYQTPYLIGSALLAFGLSLADAFKLSLSLSFLLSGISMYLFGKEYFNDGRKGLLIAIFYQFAPFRMIEYLVRGSYGEVYTYAFFPGVLYGVALLQKKQDIKGLLITAFSTALLIISHNSVSLLFTGAAVLFLVITSVRWKAVFKGLIGILSGILLASFYWIPAILEHKYTYGNLFMENLYKEHFVPVQNFFIPNFTNDPSLQTGGITTFIGLMHIIAVLLGLILFTRKIDVKTRRMFIFAFVILGISFFFMLSASSSIWAMPFSSLLRQFQFPWRFLSLVVVATSLLSVSFLVISNSFKKNLFFYGLIACVILSVAFYWKASLGYKKIDQDYYWNFPLNTTYYGETDVIWSAGPAKEYPVSRIEIIDGKGEIGDFIKKNHYQTFTTKSNMPLTLVSHTQFFPGWRAYANGNEVPIQFQDPNHRGLLVFSVPKGINKVELRFEENKLRLLANTLSVVALLTLVPVGFFVKKLLK